MAYSTKLFIFFLLFVSALFGYNYFIRPFSNTENSVVNTATPATQTTPQPVVLEEKIFNTLTTKQKISQVIMASVTITTPEAATRSAQLQWIAEHKPGFVLIFGNRVATTSAAFLQTEMEQFSMQEPVDIMLALDHEGGTVQRYSGNGFTNLPSWEDVCEVRDQDQRQALLQKSFQELQSYGIKVVLGPVFDTKVSGSPLGTRTCSSDQAIISERVKEYISLLQKYNMLPVLKHFPNIGYAKRDLHTNFDSVTISTDDLLAFKSILTSFTNIGVMTTHVGVTNQNSNIPCSLNADCVGELKNNYNSVLVFSDALEMQAAQGKISTSSAQRKDYPQLAEQAIQAGNDVIIMGESVGPDDLTIVLRDLETKYNTDDTFKNIIDASVKKIITYKLQLQNEN